MKRSRSLAYVFLAVALTFWIVPTSALAKEKYANNDPALTMQALPATETASAKIECVSPSQESVPYVKDEVIVVFDEAYTAEKAVSLMQSNTLQGTQNYVADTTVVVDGGDESNQNTIVKANLHENVSVEDAIDALETDSRVEWVQPNFIYRLLDDDVQEDESGSFEMPYINSDNFSDDQTTAFLTPSQTLYEKLIEPLVVVNDPYAQIADANSSNQNQWWLHAINAFDAWNYATCDNSVTVAVLDTGINFDHADLWGNINTQLAWDAPNNAPLTTSPYDAEFGHGTHVAGIIAAQANNSLDFAGVSYNANLLPINVFYEDPDEGALCDTETLVDAYSYLEQCMDSGQLWDLHVINMSLGGYGAPKKSDYALQSKIASMNTRGVLTVCSGGNGDEDDNPITEPSYPADFEECVSVIPLKADNTRCSWADYNEYKDLAAPGHQIWSTWIGSPDASRCMTGSSMASPVVAGCAALLFAYNSNLSVIDVKNILYETAIDLGSPGRDDYYGWGKIDIQAAFQALRCAVITSNSNDPLYTTQTRALSANLCSTQLYDPAQGTEWEWSVDDPYIATISQDGLLTARNAGTVEVTATAKADRSITGTKAFIIKPLEIPNGITTLARPHTAEIMWDFTPYASSFEVWRTTGNPHEEYWQFIGSLEADENYSGMYSMYSFYDDTIQPNVPYYYYVIPKVVFQGETIYGKASNSEAALYLSEVVGLAGDNRYETMHATAELTLAQNNMSGHANNTVIVASGQSFPDALASSGLAGLKQASLVLTTPDYLSEEARAILIAADPSKVFIAGGEMSVSPETRTEIKDCLPEAQIRRLAGESRIQTALEIYDEGKGEWGPVAILASSANFADALTVGPYAYATKSPILLVDPFDPWGLSDECLDRLYGGGFSEVLIVGGETSVPETVAYQLADYGISTIRCAGDNRYETSIEVARYALQTGVLQATHIGISTGQNYPDALSAGSLMGLLCAPLILMDDFVATSDETEAFLYEQRGYCNHLLFFGGASSLPENVRLRACQLLDIQQW